MVELLRGAARRVVDFGPVRDAARVDPEECHVADVRLRYGLEDLRHERSVVRRLELDGLGAAPQLADRRRALRRSRHQLDELREQGPGPVGEVSRSAQQRADLARGHALLHRGDGLVTRDLLAAQVALQEIVARRGDGLHHLLEVGLEAPLVLGWDVHFLVLALGRALLVHVALLREQIDDPVEVGTLTHRDLDGDDLGREVLLDVPIDLLEVCVLLVQERHEEEPGDSPLLGEVPHLLGADLDSRRRTHHHQRRVRGVDPSHGVPDEVEVTRGVNEVDLDLVPLGVGKGEADGVLPFDFIGGVVGERGPVFYPSVPCAASCHERECIYKAGLPARAVAHDSHVPNRISCIYPHGVTSFL